MSITPIFASGFDAASPLALWSGNAGGGTGANATVGSPPVVRNGNAAISNQFLEQAFYANTASPFGVVGAAFYFENQSPGQFLVFNVSSDLTKLSVQLSRLGDGRLQVIQNSAVGKSSLAVMPATTLGGEPGFVCSTGEWMYVEMGAIPTISVVPASPGFSTVTILVDVYVRINNTLIWHGSLGASGTLPNADIPSIGFVLFSSPSDSSWIEDVYANGFANPATDFLGDVKANSDDATVTVVASYAEMTQLIQEIQALKASDPILTQALFEAQMLKLSDPLFTQVVMEVAFARVADWRTYEA